MAPGLLVSVRSLGEAVMAAELGVGVVDLKEPARGPLGQPDPLVAARIANCLGHQTNLSIALGELSEYRIHQAEYLRGYSFAKIGLSNMRNEPLFVSKWQSWASAVSGHCRPVVVSYADWQAAAAPDPALLVQLAVDVRAAFMLFDTFHKRGGSLLDILTPGQLAALIEPLVDNGVPVALAGSLNIAAIEILARLPIQLVGVRGLVCRCGNRHCAIDPQRIRTLLATPGLSVSGGPPARDSRCRQYRHSQKTGNKTGRWRANPIG